jgi:hypothetical protein
MPASAAEMEEMETNLDCKRVLYLGNSWQLVIVLGSQYCNLSSMTLPWNECPVSTERPLQTCAASPRDPPPSPSHFPDRNAHDGFETIHKLDTKWFTVVNRFN